MPEPVRVVLADDHTMVRQGLRSLLEKSGIAVVGEAANGHDAIRTAVELAPDVLVMDVAMPRLNGVEATARIAKEAPSTRVLMLSMHDAEEYVHRAIGAGASGYLLKGSGIADLVAAVRAVAAGHAFFSPTVARYLLKERGGNTALTTREYEVLQLVAEGHSNSDIAQMLHISPRTIEGHRANIMKKLRIHDLPALVRYAIRHGLVQLDT